MWKMHIGYVKTYIVYETHLLNYYITEPNNLSIIWAQFELMPVTSIFFQLKRVIQQSGFKLVLRYQNDQN